MCCSESKLPPGFVMPDITKPPPGYTNPAYPKAKLTQHSAKSPCWVDESVARVFIPTVKPTSARRNCVPEGKPLPNFTWRGGPADYYDELYGDEAICTSPRPDSFVEFYTDGPTESNDHEDFIYDP